MSLPAIITDHKPSGILTSMLETPTEYLSSTDNNPYGGDVREGAWICPENVEKSTKSEAARLLAHAELALQKAPMKQMQEWLTSLGILQANKMSVEDAIAKLGAYSTLLNHPSACFTDITLDAASRKFSPWFPDYGGLADFLDGYARPIKQMVDRLRRIAEAPEALPVPESPRETEEEIAAAMHKVYADLYLDAGEDVPDGELTMQRFEDDMARSERRRAAEDEATLEARKTEAVEQCKEMA